MTSEIRIDDFNYELPENRIAVHPLSRRDECKLLLRSPQGNLYHRIFKELPDLLPPGVMLVCNDTKVINARLLFHKESGASIEIFLLEPEMPSDYALNFQSKGCCRWKCLVGNLKKWKDGGIYCEVPSINSDKVTRLQAYRISDLEKGGVIVEFRWDSDLNFSQLIEEAGKIPIPPYLNRESEESDLTDYQTIYAHIKGSVAAPTAGLHFTESVMQGLEAHNVPVERVTLHVGAGTFRPVKSETIGDHEMHSEPFTVSRQLIGKIIQWKKEGRPVCAIGTTTVRTLESLPYIGNSLFKGIKNPYHVNQWDPYSGRNDFDTVEALQFLSDYLEKTNNETLTAGTSIMIAPGFRWRIVDGMVTNFHQPKSTLLLLVSSFLGNRDNNYEAWKEIYEEALRKDYRFLSYGDACLFINGKE